MWHTHLVIMFTFPPLVPTVPKHTLGITNPSAPIRSSRWIGSRDEQGFSSFNADSAVRGSQQDRIVQSVSCVVDSAVKENTFIPRGTLVCVTTTIPKIPAKPFMQKNHYNHRDPTPSATAVFNSIGTPIQPNDTVTLFALAEGITIYHHRPQYIACAVAGSVDVAIPNNNPEFTVLPGDPVYAVRQADGVYYIDSKPGPGTNPFCLGLSILAHTHMGSWKQDQGNTISIAFRPAPIH
jgi:hypothetical protein